SDIFSFGVVLGEMVRFRPPRLARILERCVAKDPSHRWGSAGELKIQLERLIQPAPRWNLKAWAVACLAVLAIGIAWRFFAPATIVYRPSPPQVPAFIPTEPIEGPAARLEPATKKAPSLIKIEAPAGMNITRLNLSPDGRTIAYVAGGRIFLRPLGENQAMP